MRAGDLEFGFHLHCEGVLQIPTEVYLSMSHRVNIHQGHGVLVGTLVSDSSSPSRLTLLESPRGLL